MEHQGYHPQMENTEHRSDLTEKVRCLKNVQITKVMNKSSLTKWQNVLLYDEINSKKVCLVKKNKKKNR